MNQPLIETSGSAPARVEDAAASSAARAEPHRRDDITVPATGHPMRRRARPHHPPASDEPRARPDAFGTGLRNRSRFVGRIARHARSALRPLHDEGGAATAEYAIATMAAVAFAGLLVAIMRSDEVRELLTDLVRRALTIDV
ncbi:Flp pilus assembly pilin Flp [Pseudoclavibacter chungangensis]|nr:Flp pilus assembly pilin Flp [Pseudoclavibacter chungangensis]